jgi:hypothetical protein
MGKVVRLSVHRNTKQKRKTREYYDRLVRSAKSMPKDNDGWVLICYKRAPDGIDTVTDYAVNDPMDLFHLPYMVKTKLTQRIAESTITVE